jgi:hypothetical protein
VFGDHESSQWHTRIGSYKKADTPRPQFFFDSEAICLLQRLRRPDRSDDAGRRVSAWL